MLEPGIELGTSRTQSGCITSAPPSQLIVSVVVKLVNCFDAMVQNVNKQSRICGPHIFNKVIFSVIILQAWITLFGSFSYLMEQVSLLKYGSNVICKQFRPKRYRHNIFKQSYPYVKFYNVNNNNNHICTHKMQHMSYLIIR